MTVADEIGRDSVLKYVYLYYVEFLEMLCRVAIVAITIDDTLEYKVELLIEIMFDEQYKLKAMNPLDNPFRCVDENFKHHKVNWVCT